MNIQSKSIEVFYSYADSDESLYIELNNHLSQLQRESLITTFHKHQIMAGEDWMRVVDQHLNTASVILLLVSPDFLASDYCYGIEMQRAMERHRTGEARVIPILLRPADWQSAPFGELQALPGNGTPVTSWENRDEAFADVAQGIRRAIEGLTVSSISEDSDQLLFEETILDRGRDEPGRYDMEPFETSDTEGSKLVLTPVNIGRTPRRPWIQVILVCLVLIVTVGLGLFGLVGAKAHISPLPAMRTPVRQTLISTPAATPLPGTPTLTATPTPAADVVPPFQPTPIPTPIRVPSPTPVVSTPTPTTVTFPPSASPTIEDALLSNADNRWPGSGPCQFTSQGYQITSTNYYYQCNDRLDNFANGALQVNVQISSGSSGGILFRDNTSTNSGYLFGVDSLSNYEVLRADNGSPSTIREVTTQHSSLQNPSIGVMANGSSIQVYINDTEVFQFTDSTYASGGIALFVDGDYSPHVPNTQAVFTDLKIWNF